MKGRVLMTLGLVIVFGSTSSSQVLQRVSVNTRGMEVLNSSYGATISADARYVAFTSSAEDLVPGDTNSDLDVFVRDRQTGTTERASVDSHGGQVNDGSREASISADGRFVAFISSATNLVPGDTNGLDDVFIRDRQLGVTERVSIGSGGVQGNDRSSDLPFSYPFHHAISADGRYVAFASYASNLVSGDTNGVMDVFLRDRQSGSTERVSVDANGMEANEKSGRGGWAITDDGRYVVFVSDATNLVAGDTNATPDIFLRDRRQDWTERVSVAWNGAEANGGSYQPSISADGRNVAFLSLADHLAPGDSDQELDVFVRDRWAGATECLTPAWLDPYYPSISSDGRFVVYSYYEFLGLYDRQNHATEWMPTPDWPDGEISSTWVSAGGRYVGFDSYATNLIPGDTNWSTDVFVWDRAHESSISLCNPGVSGVIGCPCSNPPSGPDRGCENSSATGGAGLLVSGGEYLSSDSLVFTTSDESPNALSIVVQGTSSIASGVIYGQGVRCVGGSMKRLYVRTASFAGSIAVPDFLSGDPLVHSRSASLGDVIAAGSTRWYMVFYRDPIVLGGCPATSTFNGTQTREVSWLP